MAQTHRPHGAATAEMFRKDPLRAAEYLNAALAGGDELDLLMALKNLSINHGHADAVRPID